MPALGGGKPSDFMDTMLVHCPFDHQLSPFFINEPPGDICGYLHTFNTLLELAQEADLVWFSGSTLPVNQVCGEELEDCRLLKEAKT